MRAPNVTETQLESIQFLPNPVGSGKTQAAIAGIKLREDECHIFVSPTVNLAQEIHERMKRDLDGSPLAKNLLLITDQHKARGKSVRNTVLNEMRSRFKGDNHVLIITTKTLANILPELGNYEKSRYNIFLDEGMDVLTRCQANIGNLENDFRALLDIADETGKISVRRNSKRKMELIALGNSDALGIDAHLCHKDLIEVANVLTCDLYDVYGTIGKNRVRCVGLLKPSLFAGFNSVTMIVAMFEQSLLAKYWKHAHGVAFDAYQHDADLFDTHKEKGPLISIYHVLHSDDRASGVTLNMQYEGQPLVNSIARQVAEHFSKQGSAFCYALNVGYAEAHEHLAQGKEMPVRCAGLDEFRNFDNVASLATCLPPTWVKETIIRMLGTNGAEFYKSWRIADTYQTIGRCSIRDRNQSNPITLVVLSEEEALALNNLFPGSRLKGQLGDLPCLKNLRRVERNHGNNYTPQDTRAYSKFKARLTLKGGEVPEKSEWYSLYRKPRLETLAAT